MHKIKSYFISKKQHLELDESNFGMLNDALSLTNNSLLSFINEFKNKKTIVFVLKKRCSKHTIKTYSKLFLQTCAIHLDASLEISKFNLSIDFFPISSGQHFSQFPYSMFYHALSTSLISDHENLALLNENPKDIAIGVSNAYVQLFQDILSKDT